MTAEEFELQVRGLLDEVEQKERRPPRYGVSDAGGCVRAAVYTFREWEQEGSLKPLRTPPAWVYAAACGNGVGDALEAAARRLGWSTQVPVRWESDGLVIEGTADIVGPDFVLDGKWVRASSWREVQGAAKPEHVAQAHVYAFALGKPWAGVLYQRQTDRGTETPWIFFPGETDPSIAAMVLAHWAEVEAHRRAGSLPTRPYAEPAFECAHFCAYGETCWGSA